MDPYSINQLAKLRQQEIIAWSERRQSMQQLPSRWNFPNLFAILRQQMSHFTQQRTESFEPAADC